MTHRDYSPKPCQGCGSVFKPHCSNVKLCEVCRSAPKVKPCRSCSTDFEVADKRTQLCPACRYGFRAQVKAPEKGCETCQHGYQYQPGEWGCAINAARLCKPELLAKRWMRREVTTGRTA